MTEFHSFLLLSNIPLCIGTTVSLPIIHLLMDSSVDSRSVNGAAINMGVQEDLENSLLWGYLCTLGRLAASRASTH
jgi:hypothetical protein